MFNIIHDGGSGINGRIIKNNIDNTAGSAKSIGRNLQVPNKFSSPIPDPNINPTVNNMTLIV